MCSVRKVCSGTTSTSSAIRAAQRGLLAASPALKASSSGWPSREAAIAVAAAACAQNCAGGTSRGAANSALPQTWSKWAWVFTTQRTGAAVSCRRCSRSSRPSARLHRVSTTATPSAPTIAHTVTSTGW